MTMNFTRFQTQLFMGWDMTLTGDLQSGIITGAFGGNLPAITFGTGNLQINNLFADSRTLAASANDDLDLIGVLLNIKSEVISFTAIKGVYVLNTSAAAATKLIIGGATGTTAWTVPWQAQIANRFAWEDYYSGEPVVAGTGDVLRITNADAVNAAAYDIVIVGVSS